MTITPYVFPFGQPVTRLTQQDRNPKSVFVLGVYASAVHAHWVAPAGETMVRALAIASEPYIFWRGDGADEIINRINATIPRKAGELRPIPESMKLNGPSGNSLDNDFLSPLGITRESAWLCDIFPHSCLNPRQAGAIATKYAPLARGKNLGLCDETVPLKRDMVCDDKRRDEILAELQESGAKTLILLGDEPIKWFLHSLCHGYSNLQEFVENGGYGRVCKMTIADDEYDVLPLVHPRQAAKLGRFTFKWYHLHQEWLARMSREK